MIIYNSQYTGKGHIKDKLLISVQVYQNAFGTWQNIGEPYPEIFSHLQVIILSVFLDCPVIKWLSQCGPPFTVIDSDTYQ